MNAKYSYRGLDWIGPQINIFYEKNLFSISQEQLMSEPVSSNEFNEVLLKFIPPTNNEEDKFVIYSTYLCLDDGNIFGPPSTYKECFEKIMEFVHSEITADVTYQHVGHETVKSLLECHKILKYSE